MAIKMELVEHRVGRAAIEVLVSVINPDDQIGSVTEQISEAPQAWLGGGGRRGQVAALRTLAAGYRADE